jgi:hypothetical protein
VKESWNPNLHSSIVSLMNSGDKAIIYFTHRDLLEERVEPGKALRDLPEPRRIIKKQSSAGSWKGAVKRVTVYPENHADLIESFKAFRVLVEKYGFSRELEPVQKAAEFLFTFQTEEGDFRGFIGNQYATYYTGYVLSLLLQAGYANDQRVEKGMQWLLRMRQNDGGWTIPILTRCFDGKTMNRLTSSYCDPIEPDRTKPFSHNWTDMVLRAFAVHPVYRHSEEARAAGNLLKSQFFQPDYYSSYRAAGYWTRFISWWPNLLTALESLGNLVFTPNDQDINKGLQWFFDSRKLDSLWDCSYKDKDILQNKRNSMERAWISLRICRMLKHYIECRY